MFARLLTLFILAPLVEMTLLLMMADMTNSWWIPLLLVIVTGILGSWLARRQGQAVYREIQAELAAGRMPTDAMIDGVMVFVAGLLLLTPGIISDIVGITMFIPPIRRFYRRRLIAWFHRTFQVKSGPMPTGSTPGTSRVIDSYVLEKHSADDVSDQI